MAERIGEGLYQLDIPLVGSPLKNLNSYLITGERNLLIDTGFREDPCREAMYRQLDELGVDLEKTDIFLTHLHSDHSGLSTELHRPGCRIYISRVDGEALSSRGRERFWEQRNREYIFEGFSREEMDQLWGTNPAKEMAPGIFEDYTYVRDGEVLHYGGYALQCVETPGHTPGHMCLYDAGRQLLFSGDHVLFHISPNICRWEDMPDALGSYLTSLRKMQNLPVQTVLPAHRHDTGVFQNRVSELLAHHEKRLRDTLAVVTNQPGMTAYRIAGAMRWQIRCRSWEDFPLTQKFFAVGEALSHLDHLAAQGSIRCVRQGEKRVWIPVENKGENRNGDQGNIIPL